MPFEPIVPFENDDVKAFLADVAALYDPEMPETFWQCRASFERFAASGAVHSVALSCLMQMMDAPLDAPVRWGMQRLTLAQSESYSLNLQCTGHEVESEGDDSVLITQGGHAFIHSMSKAPFTIELFALGDVDFGHLDRQARLRPSHEVVLNPGDTIAVDGGKWVLQLEDRPDLCMLAFVSRALWPFVWSFDARTLKAYHMGHSELHLSQLRAVLQIFRELGHAPSEAVVQDLTRHPVHDVRWEAMKTLVRLDPAAGRAALQHALDDPHCDVRSAARKSLALISHHEQQTHMEPT